MTVKFYKNISSPDELKKSITKLNNLDVGLKEDFIVYMPSSLLNINYDLLKEVLYNDSKNL